MRDACGKYHHCHIIKLGKNGSIVEYDGYYHKGKNNIEKYLSLLPTWFNGLVVQRFVERDYNIFGQHNMLSFICRCESQYSLQKMPKFIVEGCEIHSDGCGNLTAKMLRKAGFKWRVFQCNHKSFDYVMYKPGTNASTAKSSEKIHNNNCENSWKVIDVLYNIKRGFNVLNASDTLQVYQSWLFYWDWVATFTTNEPSHKMSQWLNHLSFAFPPCW